MQHRKMDGKPGVAIASVRSRPGFTLIELLLVLMIIGVLMALLVPVLPRILAGNQEKQSRMFVSQLSTGLENYRMVWGSYPSDNMIENPHQLDGGGMSLLLALQGPQGTGWSRVKHKVDRDVAPFFESLRDARQATKRDRQVFVDSFGGPVLYYSAKMDKMATLTEKYDNNRYRFSVGRDDWYQQKDDDGTALGDDGSRVHWKQKLTQKREYVQGKLVEVPFNLTSYLLWTPGADRRFGYLTYRDSDKKFIWDLKGVCDDITNFNEKQ